MGVESPCFGSALRGGLGILGLNEFKGRKAMVCLWKDLYQQV